RTQKMFPRTHARARHVAVFSAQTIQTRGQRISHPSVELHPRGVLPAQIDFGQGRNLCGKIKIRLVRSELGPVARVREPVLEIRGRAPDFPAEGFGLEHVSQGVVRPGLLKLPRILRGAFQIEGVDLRENGPGIGGRSRRFLSRHTTRQKQAKEREKDKKLAAHQPQPAEELRPLLLPLDYLKLFEERSKSKWFLKKVSAGRKLRLRESLGV